MFEPGRPLPTIHLVSSLLLKMVVVSSYGAVPVSAAEAHAEAAHSSTTALKIASAVMAGLMVAVLVVAVSTNAQVNGNSHPALQMGLKMLICLFFRNHLLNSSLSWNRTTK